MSLEPSPSPVAPRYRAFDIEGQHLVYPTEFRDGCSAAGLFVVKSAVANEYIADSGFEVAEVAPGRGILVLTGVCYTDSDCGTYDETAMAFFVKKAGQAKRLPYASTWIDIIRGNTASFTWNLQVTTPLSRDAGIFMWGFPKTIEDIRYEHTGGRAAFNLRMDGQEVFNYSVLGSGSTTPAPVTSAVYSIWEGAPHVSYLTQAYRDAGFRPGGGRLRLGDHPLAHKLRALGLPRRPLLATWSGHLSFSMSAPERL
jgi:hypothetical protein